MEQNNCRKTLVGVRQGFKRIALVFTGAFILLVIASRPRKITTYKGVRIVMAAKDINVPPLSLKYKWLQLEGPQAWIVTPDSLSTWISNKQSRDLKKRSRYAFRFTATNSAGKATIKDTTFIY